MLKIARRIAVLTGACLCLGLSGCVAAAAAAGAGAGLAVGHEMGESHEGEDPHDD